MYAVALFVIMMIAMVIVFVVYLLVGLLGGGIASMSDQRRRSKEMQKTAGSFLLSGVISDAQLVQDTKPSAKPLHYKYAIQFMGADGGYHRAFLGIDSAQPLLYAVGDTVQLRVFAAPVINARPEAFDPQRGADGRLPGIINFRRWMDKPVDETGTVMLESDFAALMNENAEKAQRSKKTGRTLLIIGIVLLVLCIGGCSALFTFNY